MIGPTIVSKCIGQGLDRQGCLGLNKVNTSKNQLANDTRSTPKTARSRLTSWLGVLTISCHVIIKP